MFQKKLTLSWQQHIPGMLNGSGLFYAVWHDWQLTTHTVLLGDQFPLVVLTGHRVCASVGIHFCGFKSVTD